MQLTEIIGTKVYSIYDCTLIGFVLGMNFDNKMTKIKTIIIANDEEEIEYTLNTKNIFCLGENCILVKNLGKVEVTTSESQKIVNQTIVDLSGQIDVVKNVIFNDKFEVEQLVGSSFNILPSQIMLFKNNMLLTNKNSLDFKRKQFKPRTVINKIPVNENKTVGILESGILKPQTIVGNNLVNIVGKRLSNNLFSKQNQILAYKNSIITYNLIDLAKQFDVVDSLLDLVK